MSEKLYQVALTLVSGIGDVHIKNLISYSGSAESVFKSNKQLLLKIPGIGEKTAKAVQTSQPLTEAERILNDCVKHEIETLHYTDQLYPKPLKQIADSPSLLYIKGNHDILTKKERLLAVVGTRNATSYGKTITENIAQACAKLKAGLVSGLAYGVDIHAHRTSLTHDVPNIAVLAGGLDSIYPSAHKTIAKEITKNGLLISENPPGTKAQAHFFPARNRIIAGLCDAVVVVEAAIKGGALITANIADSYNKPVFAVPGDLNNKYSEGCNHLIRSQKAYIYTGEEDLIYHLNWESDDQPAIPKPTYEHLSEPEQNICRILMENQSLPIDELAWKSQTNINTLASMLLSMEFQGILKCLPGKKYELC